MTLPEIAKLGHVALVTPDLDTSLWFFRDLIGLQEVERTGDTVFLRASADFDHHTLSLTAGEKAVVDHIAWRTRRREDVEAFAQILSEAGADIRWVEEGEERGQGRAIRFRLPIGGHAFEIYYDMEKPGSPKEMRSQLKSASFRLWNHGISPRQLNHVNIRTSQPAETGLWLQKHMGFKLREGVLDTHGTVVKQYLSVTPLPHNIGVGPDPLGRDQQFHHVAYSMDSFHDLLRAADMLQEYDIPLDAGPGRHAVAQAMFLYFRDPGSGHRVELYSDSYLIFDPDWEPIIWKPEEYRQWWGFLDLERMKHCTLG